MITGLIARVWASFYARREHVAAGLYGEVTFSGRKIKLFGAFVGISGIELLKARMKMEAYSQAELAWKTGIHLAFVVFGRLFALMDRLAEGGWH